MSMASWSKLAVALSSTAVLIAGLAAARRRGGQGRLTTTTRAELPATMQAVVAEDGICVVKPSWPLPTMGPDEIVIRVAATAINRLDTMQRRGKSPVPKGVTEVLGLEVAGVVVSVGSAVRAFTVGDHVMALVPGGGYAEFVAVHVATAMPKPSSLSWAQAASVPEVWLTAALNLQLGNAAEGETVLVHAAASGVGLAAIQLARAAGCRVLVAGGSQEKLELCTRLGAAGGAVRHDGPWLETIRALAPGGVHVILDCVAGSYAEQNLEALAVDGRWVLYSLLGGPAVSPSLAPSFMAQLLKKRVQLLATTLRTRPVPFKRELVESFARHVLPHMGGEYELVIDSQFNGLAHAQAAHEYMESNANAGKIVLRVWENES